MVTSTERGDMNICDPSTWEVEKEAQCQRGLHRMILSQKNKNKQANKNNGDRDQLT